MVQIPLGSSHLNTTRHVLCVSRLSNSTARHDELDMLVATRSTHRMCRVATSQLEFGL